MSGFKPRIESFEGVYDYYNTSKTYDDASDPRRLGLAIGRQIIGLYFLEILLKYAHRRFPHGHNLDHLYSSLPKLKRQEVEDKYQELLAAGIEETWDFARTADTFFDYLGKNPITEARYFWEDQFRRPEDEPFILGNDILATLIAAVFIALHKFPEKDKSRPRFKTRFRSLKQSIHESE